MTPTNSIQMPRSLHSSLDVLSVRTLNCLWRMDLTTRDEVRRAIRSRVLHPGNIRARNFGWKSYREVRAWLGIKPELTSQQLHQHRAHAARWLRSRSLSFLEISTVLRLGSKEKARALCAKAERLERQSKRLEATR